MSSQRVFAQATARTDYWASMKYTSYGSAVLAALCLLPLPLLPPLLRFGVVVALAVICFFACLFVRKPAEAASRKAFVFTRWLLFATLMLFMPSLVILFVYGVTPPAFLPVIFFRTIFDVVRTANVAAVIMGAVIFGG